MICCERTKRPAGQWSRCEGLCPRRAEPSAYCPRGLGCNACVRPGDCRMTRLTIPRRSTEHPGQRGRGGQGVVPREGRCGWPCRDAARTQVAGSAARGFSAFGWHCPSLSPSAVSEQLAQSFSHGVRHLVGLGRYTKVYPSASHCSTF